MIDEEIEEMWIRTKKLMDEGKLEDRLTQQMEFFAREILQLLAVKGLFKGVGELDQEAENPSWLEDLRLILVVFPTAPVGSRTLIRDAAARLPY